MTSALNELAALVRSRNLIATQITAITGRPASLGHLGEFIAAGMFGITLEPSASNRAHDGRFQEGALQGRTVNVKWYSRHQGLIDLRSDAEVYPESSSKLLVLNEVQRTALRVFHSSQLSV